MSSLLKMWVFDLYIQEITQVLKRCATGMQMVTRKNLRKKTKRSHACTMLCSNQSQHKCILLRLTTVRLKWLSVYLGKNPVPLRYIASHWVKLKVWRQFWNVFAMSLTIVLLCLQYLNSDVQNWKYPSSLGAKSKHGRQKSWVVAVQKYIRDYQM